MTNQDKFNKPDLSDILSFDKSNLKKTKTRQRNELPTKEQIAEEKALNKK